MKTMMTIFVSILVGRMIAWKTSRWLGKQHVTQSARMMARCWQDSQDDGQGNSPAPGPQLPGPWPWHHHATF